jgi:DNA-directed RNA polymerase
MLVEILTSGTMPESLKLPIKYDGAIPDTVVRRGIQQKGHIEVARGIAATVFEVNHFMVPIIEATINLSTEVMAHRAVRTAEIIGNDKFRFPLFFDSRGRSYYDVTTGINPQGSDYEKSMCLPSFKEVLTPDGLLCLLGKADSLSESLPLTTLAPIAKAYAYASVAASPLKDRGWLQWEEPYFGLACANTIKQYLENPNLPISAFVERDGKCSGLQHWSALMRTDAITHRLGMEIEPPEDGMDIYEYVADAWKQTLPEEHKIYGVRKAAKKPVMTFAYSATRMSAMDYIRDLYPELDRKVAAKLGSTLFDKSNEILQPMVEGVDWFKACVKIISAKGYTDIQWITPDGFIAKQSYWQTEFMRVEVNIKKRKFTVDCKDTVLVDGKPIPKLSKAQSAIGPNIIHSLDATHLRMVAARLNDMGIPAVWVHDSFGVHANYIPLLDEVIRQEFINLYSRNIMQEIKEYWETFYNVELPPHPSLGNWDVQKIIHCKRFFG